MKKFYLAVAASVMALLGYCSYDHVTKEAPRGELDGNSLSQTSDSLNSEGASTDTSDPNTFDRDQLEEELRATIEKNVKAELQAQVQTELDTATKTIEEYRTKLADAEEKLKDFASDVKTDQASEGVTDDENRPDQALEEANESLQAVKNEMEALIVANAQTDAVLEGLVSDIVTLATSAAQNTQGDENHFFAELFNDIDIQKDDISALSSEEKLGLITDFVASARTFVGDITKDRLNREQQEQTTLALEAQLAESDQKVQSVKAQLVTLRESHEQQVEALKKQHIRELETYVETGQSYLQSVEKSKEEQDKLRKDMDALRSEMDSELGRKEGIIAELQSASRMLQLGADLAFGFGSVRTSDKGEEILLKVKDIIEDYPDYDVSLEGHTDNIGIHPSRLDKFPSNWELSAARAASAARFLIDQGVDPSRLRVVGLGSHRPIDSNETDEGRAENRRLEIVFIPRKLKRETIE